MSDILTAHLASRFFPTTVRFGFAGNSRGRVEGVKQPVGIEFKEIFFVEFLGVFEGAVNLEDVADGSIDLPPAQGG
jgi:hypothetical protein